MKRCFLGLQPSTNDKQQIAAWCDANLPKQVKPVAMDNFHITLAFLGLVSDERLAKLIELLNSVSNKKFSVQLSILSFWSKPKILCLTPISVAEPLANLQQLLSILCKQSGIALDERTYKPHLTLCRKAKELPLGVTDIDFTLSFSSFCLYESMSTSSGVRYNVLQSWPLK